MESVVGAHGSAPHRDLADDCGLKSSMMLGARIALCCTEARSRTLLTGAYWNPRTSRCLRSRSSNSPKCRNPTSMLEIRGTGLPRSAERVSRRSIVDLDGLVDRHDAPPNPESRPLSSASSGLNSDVVLPSLVADVHRQAFVRRRQLDAVLAEVAREIGVHRAQRRRAVSRAVRVEITTRPGSRRRPCKMLYGTHGGPLMQTGAPPRRS